MYRQVPVSKGQMVVDHVHVHLYSCGSSTRALPMSSASHSKDNGLNSAVLWQKEATVENDISRKWAKCVCHLHWHQCNIVMPRLKYLSAGWVFLLQTRIESRMCEIHSKNITSSDLGDLSLPSFCQSRAEFTKVVYFKSVVYFQSMD